MSFRTCARAALVVLGFALSPPSAQAQSAVALEASYWTAGGSSNNQFGWSVDIDGAAAIVGAVYGGVVVPDAGAAYVFTRRSGSWSQQARLEANDGVLGARFGESVAIEGNLAAVGAGAAGTPGAVYLFQRAGTHWGQIQKLEPSPPGMIDGALGDSLALDGDRMAAGAPRDSTAGPSGAGAVYVYHRTGSAWTEEAKLHASSPGPARHLGRAVVLEGDTLAAGAPFASGTGGTVHVFDRNGTQWTETQVLQAPAGAPGDNFGEAISLSGDTLAVGAYWTDATYVDQGLVHVYVRSAGTWSLQQTIAASDPVAGDRFGFSVALDRDLLLVGAPEEEYAAPHIGRAYLFHREAGTWREVTSFRSSEAQDRDAFGWSAVLRGPTALIGAPVTPPGPGSVVGYDVGELIGMSYCDPANANASGLPGTLAVFGSRAVADDHLILVADQLSPGPTHFMMGAGTNTFTPPGFLSPICIAPAVRRFPQQPYGGLGGGPHRSVGTNGPITNAITAGSAWSFQLYYAGILGPNFTNAVRVVFR